MSTDCISCPALAECPACAAGQMCQMFVPPTCQECPINKCVADPSYQTPIARNHSIAGGLFGLVGAFVILAALYSFYRKRQQKKDRVEEAARFAEKLKAAEKEKFHPGEKKEDSAPCSISSVISKKRDTDASQKGKTQNQHYSITMARSDAITTSLYDRSHLDEDTEWSELREDGHTTLSMIGESTQGDTVFAGHLLRQSAGAATHLSRITEGIEEEEEIQRQRASQQRQAFSHNPTIREEEDALIEMKDLPMKKTWSITNVNPFADSTEQPVKLSPGSRKKVDYRHDSDSYQFEIGHRWSAMTVELPTAVHRPVGSPLIAVPANANPKAGKARKSQLYSPLSALARSPSKTGQAPDWGRLCEEIKDGQVASAATPSSRVYNGMTHSHKQEGEGEGEETMSYSIYESAETHGRKQTEEDANETMADASNRLSVISTSTVDSVAYSMMSSQIVTPFDKGGIQRLQLKQSKAQLVRVNSEKRADQKDKGRDIDRENEIRQRKSHSVSMLDSICNIDVTTLKAPMPGVGKSSGDSNNQAFYSMTGDESGLDPAMTPYRLSAIISTKSESISSDHSFGLPPFRETSKDEENVEGFLQRCSSDVFRHDSITSAHTDSTQQQQDEDQHDRDIYRQSDSTITGLSALDDIPFEVHSNENSHESTETLKSGNQHYTDVRRQQNRF